MNSFHPWLQDLDQKLDQERDQGQYPDVDQGRDQSKDQDIDQNQDLELELDQGFVSEYKIELLCILFILDSKT